MLFLFLLLAQVSAVGRPENPDLLISVETTLWPFGSAVAGCGDLDGDGISEFAVGSPCAKAGATGVVRLFSGGDGCELASWRGRRGDGHFGFRLLASDLRGCGTADLLVAELGPPEAHGKIHVFSGLSSAARLEIVSGVAGDDFGWSLDVGDVNGDGRPEIVVGAPSADDGAGCVYLFSDRGRLLDVLYGEHAGDRLGWSLDATGDLDGDGINDLVIGAPRAGGAGAAYVHSVARGVLQARLDGISDGEAFGFSVRSLQSASGPSLAVGAPWRDGVHSGEGVVRLFSPQNWREPHAIAGHRPNLCGIGATQCMAGMRFGYALANIPEPEGVARTRLAISAPGAYSGGSTYGWVALVSSDEGRWLRTIGGHAVRNFGAAIAPLASVGVGLGPGLLVGEPGDAFNDHSTVDRIHPASGEHLGRVEVHHGPDGETHSLLDGFKRCY